MHFSESRVPIENRFLMLSNSKYLNAVVEYYSTANPLLKIMYWSRQLAAISCMLPILYQIRHWTINFLEFKVFYDIWVKTISIPDSRWVSIIRTKKWMWSKFESVEKWAAVGSMGSVWHRPDLWKYTDLTQHPSTNNCSRGVCMSNWPKDDRH